MTILVVDRTRPVDVLTSLREAAVDRIDLLIMSRAGRGAADAVRAAMPVAHVEEAGPGDAFAVAGRVVTVTGSTAHLGVAVDSAPRH